MLGILSFKSILMVR